MLWSEPQEDMFGEAELPVLHRGDRPAFDLTEALLRTVDRQILPSLMAGRGASAPSRAALADHCAARIAAGDGAALTRALTEARRRGVLPEQVCLTLLTDVARRLGELWLEDRCSFVDVTEGVQLAQRALFDLGPAFGPIRPGARCGSVLLGTAPGEQHGFGAAMVGEFFHRAGWNVGLAPLPSVAAWTRAVAEESFDVAGISLGRDEGLSETAALIAAIRRASRNPRIAVLVGGPAFIKHPHRAFEIKADATAADAADAVRQATALLDRPGRVA
jgi:methanogenic corrinoid protein MtbC1